MKYPRAVLGLGDDRLPSHEGSGLKYAVSVFQLAVFGLPSYEGSGLKLLDAAGIKCRVASPLA